MSLTKNILFIRTIYPLVPVFLRLSVAGFSLVSSKSRMTEQIKSALMFKECQGK